MSRGGTENWMLDWDVVQVRSLVMDGDGHAAKNIFLQSEEVVQISVRFLALGPNPASEKELSVL